MFSLFAKIKFAFFYWLIFILVFEISRLGFFLYNFHDTKQFATTEILRSFGHGLRMDASMASYLLLPVCVFLLLGIFINSFAKPVVYKIYTAIILIPVLLIIFCDLPVYKAWGNRLDSVALKYLASPKEAWASVSNLPVFWITLCLLLVYLFLYKKIRKFIENNQGSLFDNRFKTLQLLLLLVFSGLQVIPIRGGFQQSPLNQSGVYFSKSNFINLATVNVNWNFVSSVLENSASTKNPYLYLDSSKARLIKDSLFESSGHTEPIINLKKTPSPNIIIIVWESGVEKASQLVRNGTPVMPGLNQLKKEGVYFSNIYCSGDRTDKGIAAVLSGYPSQPITSIVKNPQKSAKLPTLPNIYRQQHYRTAFYYGGELEFANMKSYLLGCGFETFISKENFSREEQNSKWGAHDHIVKDRIMQDLSKKESPFFATWLTLSSHEPFETPVPAVIKGSDAESLYLNSLHYTDSTIYQFVQECKLQPWWNNTIILITADHGHRLPRTVRQVKDFRIPLLIVGGALTQQGIQISNVGSQTDIPATLLAQTNAVANPFVWSKNLFDSSAKSWAYFSISNSFGFVEQDKYFIYDNVGKIISEKYGDVTETDIERGQAMEQESFGDYLRK